jgi:glycerophosphoryl diester phosphodiesterase
MKKIILLTMIVFSMNGLIKIGHRGACGYEPENTLRSFARAIELNVDMIEFDVMQCASGEIVVIHDETVDRTTNGHGKVCDLTLDDLKKLDAGDGEKIPTLEEVLDLVNKRCKVNIELKGLGVAQKVNLIIEDYITKHGWTYDNFLVSSFEFNEIKDFKQYNTQVQTELLFYEFTDYIKLAKEFDCNFIGLDKNLVNKEIVDDAHKNKIKILVYTVNEFADIQYLKKLGVDGIFSNYPDRL